MSDERIRRRAMKMRPKSRFSDPCEHAGQQWLGYQHESGEPSPVAMVEIWGVYDGGLFYQCQECRLTWHRWLGGRLHDKAEEIMAIWEEKRLADAQQSSAQGEGGTATTAPDVPELR